MNHRTKDTIKTKRQNNLIKWNQWHSMHIITQQNIVNDERYVNVECCIKDASKTDRREKYQMMRVAFGNW